MLNIYGLFDTEYYVPALSSVITGSYGVRYDAVVQYKHTSPRSSDKISVFVNSLINSNCSLSCPIHGYMHMYDVHMIRCVSYLFSTIILAIFSIQPAVSNR